MKRRGRPPYPDLLTPREQEVLALLRDGLSNDQIAGRLGVSLAGAKYHVSEILGKLGVSSREEAARWRGEERPWWLAALAPFDALRHRFAWLPQALVATTALALIAATALLILGLLRTDGHDTPRSALGSATTAPSPTFDVSSLPPIPTGEPYQASPVNCPGTFAIPEEAIKTCIENLFDAYIYVGDCASPTPVPSTGVFDRPCSTLEASEGEYRAYQITDVAVDAFDRLILQQTAEGWSAILRAGCAIQNQIDIDQSIDARQSNVAAVRQDDCRFLPPPFDRPTLRLGPETGAAVSNGRTELQVWRALLYPGRGIRIPVSVHNVSGQTLPWTADIPSSIQLESSEGQLIVASDVGGMLARDVAAGMPPNAYWSGWLVFPNETLGIYTLLYPGQQPLSLDLTPIDCLIVCGPSKQE